MATKKKGSTTKSSSRNTSAKKSPSKATETISQEQTSARRQMRALLLFAVSILLFLMAIIRGENAWTWLHNLLLGLFSFNACIIPFLMAFVAVMLALEKDEDGLSGRMWQCTAFAVLLNSTIFAFAVDTNAYNFKQAIAHCYTRGVSYRGSGAVGAVFGWPIERLFGDTGARILLIVLSVVFLMLMTGTTISSIIRLVRKPYQYIRFQLQRLL